MTVSIDHAREHLARVLPWPDAHEPGYINIHWTVRLPNRDKPIWDGRACRTLDEAVKTVKWADSLNSTRDIYVCMSRQDTSEEKTSRQGNKYRKAIRNQANALLLKSFYIDLDFKGYDTPQVAISALGEFLQATNLPRPSMIVRSGGGLHVYWTLMEALTPKEWKPLALALVNAITQHGLKCDAQCTSDSARVLRVAGTWNRKLETPRAVAIGARSEGDYTLGRMAQALDPYRAANPSPGAPLPQQTPIQGVSDLEAGIVPTRTSPIDLASLVPQCPFMLDALATGGKDYANPLWNLTTLLSTFVQDGRKAAHLMARRHPDYKRETTDELFDRKEKEKVEKNIGWPACRTIHSAGATQCKACPHFAANKSPLNLGKKVIPVAQVLASINLPGVPIVKDDLPDGYIRDKNQGIVYKIVPSDDGSTVQVPVSAFPMLNGWLNKNPWTLHFTTVTDKIQQINLPTALIGSNEMRRALQDQLFMMRGSTFKLVEEFLVAWVTKLKEIKEAVISSSPFGWVIENGSVSGFAYGGKVFTPNGDKIAPSTDSEIAHRFQPTGSIDPWKVAAPLVIAQERPALEAIMATAFAAPLVRFTSQRGLLMSAYSARSGIGKSTAAILAQSVWGDPKAMSMLNDSPKSVANKMGIIRSLPIMWDELQEEADIGKFINLVFQAIQGREGTRLTSNITQRKTGEWMTLMTVCSNHSVLERVAEQSKTHAAGIYRIFEFEVEQGDGRGRIPQPIADERLQALEENYGLVGLDYAQYLGGNFATVALRVKQYQLDIVKRCNFAEGERFWGALIAAICMGATLANELKYCDFNVSALEAYMIHKLNELRGVADAQSVDMNKASNVSNVLGRFLSDMGMHTIWTDKVWNHQGQPPKNAIKLVREMPRGGVKVQIGVEARLMRIQTDTFKDWLAKNGYPSASPVIKGLQSQYNAKLKKAKLGSGVDGVLNSKVNIIELDLSVSSDINFIG